MWACVSHRSGGRVSLESPRGVRESTREVGVKGIGWGRFAWHDVDQASDLEAVATADGASIAKEIRLAVADRVEDRRKDPAFQTRIRSTIEQNQRLFAALASGGRRSQPGL